MDKNDLSLRDFWFYGNFDRSARKADDKFSRRGVNASVLDFLMHADYVLSLFFFNATLAPLESAHLLFFLHASAQTESMTQDSAFVEFFLSR